MNSIQWLEQHALGFRDLPESDRQEIFHFVLLWSLYECKVHSTRASPHAILAQTHEWSAQRKLSMPEFAKTLQYFRGRYFENGRPTQYFDGLNLRNNDSPKMVQTVLTGKNNDPADCVAALLIVVYRLRNNLFHGTKWVYGIKGQVENFKHANAVLMNAITVARHPNS